MITFKDIKNKKSQIKDEKAKSREAIKESINEFLKIYVDSLQLPAETFKFKDGRDHPYVFVVNKVGFQTINLTLDDLEVDTINGASFVLNTVVDDEPPFPRPVQTYISAYFVDGNLEYSMKTDNINNTVFFPVKNESDLRTFCELVKKSIIEKIESEQIGKKSAKDESINLWD
ncbi:hypothetical protein [Klebsiella aerogenes]|uniref:Uncharacterized protein n=1 Tax=Klebsiella aerogenes TaxID=548 RepID=A0AAP9U5D1_KLEAE|nr:hypothetical protein [Klebsiella aerogenes]QMR40324.1 hypothetical protein HV331_12895 [Klebsiella aerogenes]